MLLATTAAPVQGQIAIANQGDREVRMSVPMALTVTPTQQTTAINTVTNQLLGQWQANDPTTNERVTLIFTPDDELFFVLPAKDGSAIAIKTAYQINSTTQPRQLDMALTADETALTIFELTPEGKLRLELKDITPGQPRPTAFSPNALLFERVSDATTVPDTIQVVELESQTNPSGSAIVAQYITLLSRAQQAYYLENGRFAADIQELGIVTALETELYRYNIVPSPDSTQSVAITAQPKESGLPSYIGAVFATKGDSETITVATICETKEPSTSPPPMPTPPGSASLEIQCPAGSRSLQ